MRNADICCQLSVQDPVRQLDDCLLDFNQGYPMELASVDVFYGVKLAHIQLYTCFKGQALKKNGKYRIFARIRHTFFGQNWGVHLICELDLKLFFCKNFCNFFKF